MRGVVAALAVLAVAGCSGSAEPSAIDDEPAQSSEEQDKDTPSPPETPEPTKGKGGGTEEKAGEVDPATAEQAEGFVRGVVEETDKTWLGGSTSKLEEMFAKECFPCTDYLGDLDEIYQDGGSVKGGSWSGWDVEAKSSQGDRILVEVTGGIEAYTIVAADGGPTKYPAESAVSEYYYVTESSGDWQVVEWTRH